MKKIYHDWIQIERWAKRIALDILKTDWRPDYIVGLTRGGLIPATIISHTLKVSLRDDTHGSEHNAWMPEDVMDGKSILIVDDINDTGETLAWIREDWDKSVHSDVIKEQWHKRIRVAVLVNNLASEEQIDWCAMDINKADYPCWVVFPWEHDA